MYRRTVNTCCVNQWLYTVCKTAKKVSMNPWCLPYHLTAVSWHAATTVSWMPVRCLVCWSCFLSSQTKDLEGQWWLKAGALMVTCNTRLRHVGKLHVASCAHQGVDAIIVRISNMLRKKNGQKVGKLSVLLSSSWVMVSARLKATAVARYYRI